MYTTSCSAQCEQILCCYLVSNILIDLPLALILILISCSMPRILAITIFGHRRRAATSMPASIIRCRWNRSTRWVWCKWCKQVPLNVHRLCGHYTLCHIQITTTQPTTTATAAAIAIKTLTKNIPKTRAILFPDAAPTTPRLDVLLCAILYTNNSICLLLLFCQSFALFFLNISKMFRPKQTRFYSERVSLFMGFPDVYFILFATSGRAVEADG